ncbi:MAG: cell wall hydrolase [Lachnospiraceae bacterium]|nr:cell wall hydrolase [Lachnospiraceae bacterium]
MKRKGRHRIVAAVVVSALYVSALPVTDAYAATTREQLEQAQQQHEETKSKIDETKENIDSMQDVKSTLEEKLEGLNADLSRVSENLAELEKQIEQTNEEIEQTQSDLEEAKKTEKQQYENMKKRIQFMYEKKDTMYLEILLSAGSFSDFINKNSYIEKLSEYDSDMFEKYQETRKTIEEKEAELEAEKKELDELKEQAVAEQKKVAGYVNSTSSSISKYTDQIADAEAQAQAYEEQAKKEEENIAYLKKKLAEEIAMSKLAAQSSWRDISDVNFEEGDRYLLANLIYCEAGGEPYAGQLAVGAVVINRVLSSVYPDTVVGVIYQNKQFSPVASGRLALALAEGKATAACYKAADEAMAGQTNVGNCVYFRTPIDGLTGIQIGGHIFY